MNNESKPNRNQDPVRFTKRGEFIIRAGKRLGGLAITGLAIAGSAALYESTLPDFHGEKIERIDNEKTVTDLAEHVDGVENGNLNATVDKIVRDNPQVFQKGHSSIEYDDLGKDVNIPESVD